MATYLILCTFMTTLSMVSLGVSIYLNRVSQVKAKESVTLASDMRVAYNAQTEVVEMLVAKIADIETSQRMRK